VTTLLALKTADGVAKEHFLNFRIFLLGNRLVVIGELVQKRLTVGEVFGNVLLGLTFVQLIVHSVQQVSQELS
jgi:hypothetical protein